jgi:hypothetical protein
MVATCEILEKIQIPLEYGIQFMWKEPRGKLLKSRLNAFRDISPSEIYPLK